MSGGQEQHPGLATRLADAVDGEVITRDHPAYDEARRVWNGMIDRYPLAIVRAAGPADVGPVLEVARETGIPLAIRGGGHNVAGNGTVEDGIVLDLGRLDHVEVDAAARTVTVGPGATLADVDRATEPHALAVPIGVVSGTGMAGLTLGGGVGWLTRPYGLTADNLISVDLVTVDGRTITASEDDEPELFWAVRGGGGNFGVVTSFTFRAYPLGPSVFAGNVIYRRGRWTEALQAYAEWTRDLPDAMNSIVTWMVPPADWDLGDEVLMIVGFVWAGQDHDAGAAALEPFRAAAPPDEQILEPTGWIAWQSAADGLFPNGVRGYWKNVSFDALDDDVIATLIERCGAQTWRGTAADLHHMGGAFGRVPEEATPFPNRSARYLLNIYGYWPDAADDADRTAWVKGFHAAMAAHGNAGEYVNFLGREDVGADPAAVARRAYGPQKLERLVAVKRRFDPGNVLRLNHNIPPR
jgi:FAD/FMN-containing dehydrogenase